METEFLSQVEGAIDLVRKHQLRELGNHPLTHQLPNLVRKGSGLEEENLDNLAAAFKGDVVRETIAAVVEGMKPSTPEDLDQANWRHYIILKDYVIRGQRWSTVAEHLGLARAAFFDWRKRAVEALALELWHREQNAGKRPAPVHHLPHPPYTDYIPRVDDEGRDYVERIIDELTTGRAWIVAIYGPAGVGKTTVAYETAGRCLDRELFDAIIWTSAQQQVLRPPEIVRVAEYVTSLETILDVIGATLGRREVLMISDVGRKKEIVQELLTENRSLVIIDNLETLTKEKLEEVYTFLEGLPRPSTALITGRERYYIGQNTITLPGMEWNEARKFMQEEARQRELRPLSSEEACRIHKETRGNPLAMQQAIGLIQNLGYTLDESLAFGDIQPHDEMLDFMYDGAYERLQANDKKILHIMPLFAEPARVEAIAAVSGVAGVQLTIGLGNLYRSFLVQKANEMHYELLPFTRKYLRSRQRRDGLLIEGVRLVDFLTDAHRNLARHYLEYLNAIRKLDDQLSFLGLSDFAWFSRSKGTTVPVGGPWTVVHGEHHAKSQRASFLKNEKKNILGLMGWCYENEEWQLVIDLVSRMERPLSKLRYLEELIEWGQRGMKACEAAGNLEQREWFKVHNVAWSLLQMREKERQRGRAIIEESLGVAQEEGYRQVEALALRNLGRLAMRDENYEEALNLFEKSLSLWKAAGNQEWWIAHTTHALGEVKFKRGQLDEAREDLTRAREILRTEKDISGAIETMSDLALVLLAQEEKEEALKLSDACVRLAKGIQEPARAYAYAQQRRAEIEKQLDNTEEAIKRAEEAKQTYEDLGVEYAARKVNEFLESLKGEVQD